MFGDRYGIARLIEISFQKLHQALVSLEMNEDGVSEVLGLLQFVFKDLVLEKLKQLMVHYATYIVEHL